MGDLKYPCALVSKHSGWPRSRRAVGARPKGAVVGLVASLLCSLGQACAGASRLPGREDPWHAQGRAAVEAAVRRGQIRSRARNAILFVGDGMGVTTVTAARILAGQLEGRSGEEGLLEFERFPHLAHAKTYNTNRQTPDSAGTMTALITGVKTKAGVLSLDDSAVVGDPATGRRVMTLIEAAEMRGLSTAVVSTARLTHATPAACYAHSPSRAWEDDSMLSSAARAAGFPDLARQLIEFPFGDGLEVVLGGGRCQFLPQVAVGPEGDRGCRLDGRDLANEWMQRLPRARTVFGRAGFEAAQPSEVDHLLGLFESSHMRFESARAQDPLGEPSLAEMTRKAISFLSKNPLGYVAVIEAGRIDHAHHTTNASRALRETIELSRAVAVATELTRAADTLIVVTADHGHVFTVGGYAQRGNPILGLVAGTGSRGERLHAPTLAADGLPFTVLGYANGPTHVAGRRPDLRKVDVQGLDYQQTAGVPLPAETHSAEDVAIYARGPGSYLLSGTQEQSYVFHAIWRALEFDRLAPKAPAGGRADSSPLGP